MRRLWSRKKPAAPPEIVEGILHQGSKMIIGGTSKGRKTWALLDLEISVATGSHWWGFKCSQGRACYINLELQECFVAERLETIAAAKGVKIPVGALSIWNLRGYSASIENLTRDFLAMLRARNFALIIIDPIYKALGDRDENRAGDIASLCNELDKLAVQTGAAVVFGSHYSKGNQAAKESIDRIGGSGVFARDPDSILTMTRHEEEDAFTVEATLRNLKPVQPFVVRWGHPLFRVDEDLDPASLKQPRKNHGEFKKKYSKSQLLDELSVANGTPILALKKCMDQHFGMSKPTFYRLLDELRRDKSIVEDDGELFRRSS